MELPIKDITRQFAFSVYIPSLKKEVEFLPLSIAQHRKIYESANDNLVFQTKFVIQVYNILKENCIELEIVDNLTVFDVITVLIHFRNNLFGKTDYKELVDKLNQTDYSVLVNQSTTPNFIFSFHVPVYKDVYDVENEYRNGTSFNSYVEMFSSAYITETLKIIEDIQYRENINDPYTSVSFRNINVVERIKIINTLPSNLSGILKKQLIDYYKFYTDLLTVGDEVLDIRADFFIE